MGIRLDNTLFKGVDSRAEYSMIWLHGLGANADDMTMLVEQMQLNDLPLRYAFMNASVRPVTVNNFMPMPAWYDIVGVDLNSRQDKVGIAQSHQRIDSVIGHEIEQGIKPENIFLAGFSQGGAMALYAGLKSQYRLAGIVALSAYLPLHDEFSVDNIEHPQTPIFMATGLDDPIVFPAWSEQSAHQLRALAYDNVTLKTYPMEHAVCIDEIRDLSLWLRQRVEA